MPLSKEELPLQWSIMGRAAADGITCILQQYSTQLGHVRVEIPLYCQVNFNCR